MNEEKIETVKIGRNMYFVRSEGKYFLKTYNQHSGAWNVTEGMKTEKGWEFHETGQSSFCISQIEMQIYFEEIEVQK